MRRATKHNAEVLGRDPSIGALHRERSNIYGHARAGTCNAPHPTRKENIKGVVHFTICQRPVGHKMQHRARTKVGFVWWS